MAADKPRSDAWPSNASTKMQLLATAAVVFSLGTASLAHAQGASALPASSASPPMRDDVRMIAPALERYAQGALFGNLWRRPDLAPRDRSLVTLSALIARNQMAELPHTLDLALDNGVKPGEISEVITHLAFYAGWPNAMAAVAATKDVFARRGIGADELPLAQPELLPLNQAAEAQRVASVAQQVGPVAPSLEQFTTDVLFRDLWLRPGLAPRDRSLVTVSALIAAGQFAQLAGHLSRGMDNGLTRAEASEMVTHLAFYAGWPNAFSAVPVLKGVFESRPN